MKLHPAIIIGGAAVTVAIADYASMPATGIPTMDRPGIRIPVWVLSRVNGLDPRLVLALVRNESQGDPANFVGDRGSSHGPSIGPVQVLRTTAKAFGLWTPSGTVDERAEYESHAQDVWSGIAWGIAVFKDALRQSGGDVNEAFRIYNGGPNYNDAAIAYAARAVSFLSTVGFTV